MVEDAARFTPDAILMGIEVPFIHGIQATRRIVVTCPTAIVVISAYKKRQTVEAAMAAGASGYLVKPVTDEQIEPALRTAVARFAARS